MNEKIYRDSSAEESGYKRGLSGKAIDFNALRVFVAVADSAGFTAAAKKLGMPKWSVSRNVSSLEAAMGIPLLHRTTRRVSLSPAGAALHERIAPLLSSLDHASREWQEKLGEPAGNVRIAITNFLQITPVGDAIARFTAKYPAVHVDIYFSDLIGETVGEGFDMAIVIGAEKLKDSSLLARRGWSVIGQLFASPEYLEKHGALVSMANLAQHEAIHFPDVESVQMVGPNGKTTFKANGHIHSNDVFFAREMLRSGAGIGLLPMFLAEKDVADGRLVHVLPNHRSANAYVYITRPYTREVPLRVKLLSNFLFEFMKANPITTFAK